MNFRSLNVHLIQRTIKKPEIQKGQGCKEPVRLGFAEAASIIGWDFKHAATVWLDKSFDSAMHSHALLVYITAHVYTGASWDVACSLIHQVGIVRKLYLWNVFGKTRTIDLDGFKFTLPNLFLWFLSFFFIINETSKNFGVPIIWID